MNVIKLKLQWVKGTAHKTKPIWDCQGKTSGNYFSKTKSKLLWSLKLLQRLGWSIRLSVPTLSVSLYSVPPGTALVTPGTANLGTASFWAWNPSACTARLNIIRNAFRPPWALHGKCPPQNKNKGLTKKSSNLWHHSYLIIKIRKQFYKRFWWKVKNTAIGWAWRITIQHKENVRK